MRRTVFVTTLDNAALIQAACAGAVAARERRKVLGWLAEAGLPADAARRRGLAGGRRAGRPAGPDRPRRGHRRRPGRRRSAAGERDRAGPGHRFEGRQSVSSRVLFLLAAQGQAVRGRPRGGWTSHQYRWSPLTAWCPDGLADCRPRRTPRSSWPAAGCAACGPATPDDLHGGRAGPRRRPAGADRAEAGRGRPGRRARHRPPRRHWPGTARRSPGPRCCPAWTPPR